MHGATEVSIFYIWAQIILLRLYSNLVRVDYCVMAMT